MNQIYNSLQKPVLQLCKCTVKEILKLVSFRMQQYNTNNICQYMLGLQIEFG